MKTMQIALMIGAVALMSGCGTMSASRGEFGVSGMTSDPVHATAVAGTVTTNQYNAETQRLVSIKMIENGMAPGYAPVYGGYGGAGQFGVGGSDYWFHYRNQVGQQYTMPAPPPVVIQNGGVIQGQPAIQQDLQRIEGKADDSLCLHWKQKPENRDKPLSQCPLKQ